MKDIIILKKARKKISLEDTSNTIALAKVAQTLRLVDLG